MPKIKSCDWIKCKYNSYKPGDNKAGECLKEKPIKLIANKEDDKLECSSYNPHL